jgi:hypothetical protein
LDYVYTMEIGYLYLSALWWIRWREVTKKRFSYPRTEAPPALRSPSSILAG